MDFDETYFKVYRKIFKNVLWTNPLELRLFLWIVGHAVFEPSGIKIGNIQLSRGQYLRSYSKLIDDLAYIDNRRIIHYSKSQIHRAIKKLESLQIITSLETELGTLFTLINYNKYQPLREFIDGLGTGLGTNLERLVNDNNNVLRKNKNIYAIENLPIGLNGDLFLKTKFFYVTMSLITEFKEKFQINIGDDGLRTEFYKMETWIESHAPKKDYKMFFINWLKKPTDKNYKSSNAASPGTPAADQFKHSPLMQKMISKSLEVECESA